jgi:hypothetical protein
MNAADPTATDPMAADQAATDPTADPNAGTEKAVLITDKGDGTFQVQPMTGGAPDGDPVSAQSLDDAMAQVQTALGGDTGANPDQAGDQGTEGTVNPDAAGDQGAGTKAAPVDEAATYAQKKGTRPKVKPSLSDYMNAPPEGK